MATHADTLAAGAVGGREGQFVLVVRDAFGGVVWQIWPIAAQ